MLRANALSLVLKSDQPFPVIITEVVLVLCLEVALQERVRRDHTLVILVTALILGRVAREPIARLLLVSVWGINVVAIDEDRFVNFVGHILVPQLRRELPIACSKPLQITHHVRDVIPIAPAELLEARGSHASFQILHELRIRFAERAIGHFAVTATQRLPC